MYKEFFENYGTGIMYIYGPEKEGTKPIAVNSLYQAFTERRTAEKASRAAAGAWIEPDLLNDLHGVQKEISRLRSENVGLLEIIENQAHEIKECTDTINEMQRVTNSSEYANGRLSAENRKLKFEKGKIVSEKNQLKEQLQICKRK